MAGELYPLHAPNAAAGTYCVVKECPNYARFMVSAASGNGQGVCTCGHHLSVVTKSVYILEGKAAIVQSIPGNWGSEKVVFDGKVVDLPAADRRKALIERS